MTTTNENASLDDIAKAMTMFEGISRRDPALATTYVADDVVNHNPNALPGIAGIAGFVGHLPQPPAPIEVVRAFQDFRFENGTIAEHWDNVTGVAPPNDAGHTAIDGPTLATDLDATETNKRVIRDFYETLFLKGEVDQVARFFDGDRYVRHDARGRDGLSALRALMRDQAARGVVMQVAAIRMILGQGNFVLVAADGSIAGKPVAYYDLFRLENERIAEHWDVIEEIPPQSQWRNQSGKF